MEKKLTCIIIDDEPLARDVVARFVKDVPFLEWIATFEDPVEALMFLRDKPVDLVFTDIEMPRLNGLDLARALDGRMAIIFITAYRDFALEGFDTGAADYLVKPLRFERFLKAVDRARTYLGGRQEAATEVAAKDRIFIKSEGRLVRLAQEEILYVEAQGDYLKIVGPAASYLTQATLKSMEELLSATRFIRIQRSFILNLEAVRSVQANMVELVNGTVLPVAPNRKEELFNRLGLRQGQGN